MDRSGIDKTVDQPLIGTASLRHRTSQMERDAVLEECVQEVEVDFPGSEVPREDRLR